MEDYDYVEENIRAIDLSDDELKQAYKYYKYWYDYMREFKVKSLSEEEIDWYNELKNEMFNRQLKLDD